MNQRSKELLELARAYVGEQDLTDVLGVLVGGSTAWGVASPVSDVDVFFIAPSIEGRVSSKVAFRDEFVDHVWLARSIFEDRAALLDDDFRSYTFGRVVVLEEHERGPEGWLSEVCGWLREQVSRPTHVNRYVERRVAAGRAAEEAATIAAGRRTFGDLGRVVARAATEYGQALLHRVPAGHCGTWTANLVEWARQAGEYWLPQSIETALFPEGVPTTGLAHLIDEVVALHADTARPPHGPDVGCGPANGPFFARKARHYLERGDPVSCHVVLRRLAHYAESSITAKLAVKDDPAMQHEAEALRDRLSRLNQQLWAGSPTTIAGAERALAALASLRERASREVLVRVSDTR